MENAGSARRSETPEAAGESHFRNAKEDYERAAGLFRDYTSGKTRAFHPNPEFKSTLGQAWQFALESANALEYAKQLGGASAEEIKELEDKLDALTREIKEKRQAAAPKGN